MQTIISARSPQTSATKSFCWEAHFVCSPFPCKIMLFDQICGFANKTFSISDGGKFHNLCSALHNVVSFDITLCSAEQRLCLTILTSNPPIVANCTQTVASLTLTSPVNNRLTVFQYKSVMGLISPPLVWKSKSPNSVLCTELGGKDRNMLVLLHRTGCEGQKYACTFAQKWVWRTATCLCFCTELGAKDRNMPQW